MCLGVPGRIAQIWDAENGARMARVEFPDQARDICLAYLPDLRVGDYTIAHAGFALTRIEEESAMVTLDTMRAYGVFGDPSPPSSPPSSPSSSSPSAGPGAAR